MGALQQPAAPQILGVWESHAPAVRDRAAVDKDHTARTRVVRRRRRCCNCICASDDSAAAEVRVAGFASLRLARVAVGAKFSNSTNTCYAPEVVICERLSSDLVDVTVWTGARPGTGRTVPQIPRIDAWHVSLSKVPRAVRF